MYTSSKRNLLTVIAAAMLSILIALCFSAAFSRPAYANTTYHADISVKYEQSEARSMLSKINSFRTGSNHWYWNETNTKKVVEPNITALKYDYKLEKVAMKRAAEIAFAYSHTRPNGKDWYTAYSELGYKYKNAGENIAAGFSTAESVFVGWREDSYNYSGQGHRRNMLAAKFKYVGIGHAYYNGVHYWVQEFSDTKGSTTMTHAVETTNSVNIAIASSKIRSSTLTSSPSSLNLTRKETEAAPKITATMSVPEHWPMKSKVTVKVSPDFSTSNKSIVTISGNKVKAVNTGSTSLKAKALGKTLDIPVKVTAPISGTTITLSQSTYFYDGFAVKPAVTVKDGVTKLKEGVDYSVVYENNVNAGHPTVTIHGIGKYSGSVTKYFTISTASIATATVSAINPSYEHTGAAITPVPIVKTGKAVLKAGIDYTVSYSSNVNAGTATVTITGKGNYTGSMKKTFLITD